jgi:preprotein translocase subunit SecD
MSATWWTKISFIALALLGAIYVLLPSILGESAEDRLLAQAATVNEASMEGADAKAIPWWLRALPNKRINLGLDLRGGIELTLQVETDEAVISSVQRDADPFLAAAKDDGVGVLAVERVRGEPSLMVRIADSTSLTDLQNFVARRYRSYAYKETRTVDGFGYHVFEMTEEYRKDIAHRAVEQALDTLRNRIDETGVKEPSIVLKGSDRINVQLPGIDNLQQAVSVIGTTAVLEFLLVDEDVKSAAIEKMVLEAEKQLDAVTFADDDALSDWLVRTGRLPRGDRLVWEYRPEKAGKVKTNRDVRGEPLVVKEAIILTGDDVNDAHVGMNQYNEPYVALEFKPAGGRVFADVTGKNVGKRFAIVLDDKLRSAPVIRERIPGGRCSIEMGQGSYQQLLEESSLLSLVLRTGALPAPVTIGEVRTVGSTLGADAIRSGLAATIIGGTLVLGFMFVYYRKLGVVANLALAMNIFFLFALLATLGATLTLPGIAGIALTVGMAVDCNIIFYERIREELSLGKNARSAVDAGFNLAFSAILDANLTTFIAGVVLYSYGTGPIKGFAVTLMIGIVTTMFTGVFVSRTFSEFMVRRANSRLAF